MSKIEETVAILKTLGLPAAQQNERSALTLLALLDLKKDATWTASKKRTIRIHDIIVFIQENYARQYAENTRETIRRQTIHQFEQAGIVVRNPDDPFRPTNSPNTVYSISDDALEVVRKYSTSNWQSAVEGFVKNKGKLNELKIPITEHDKLPDVILYDGQKNQIFLIEAVTAHGPLSPKRQHELEVTLKDCTARRIYVSAFPDFREFKRHIDNIAWETEVWIENNPDHMIHFDGLKFVAAYSD